MNSSAHQQEQTEQSLSSGEAQLRLARDGYNELPSAIRRDTLAIALSVAREPMFLLLIASAVVYFVLGDVRESLVLSLSVVIIFAITIFQERKTERALDAFATVSRTTRCRTGPLLVLIVLGVALQGRESDATARTLTFTSLVVGLLGLITVNRSWSRNLWQILRSSNTAYCCVMAGASALLAAILYLPFLRGIFRFASLSLQELGFAMAAGFATLNFARRHQALLDSIPKAAAYFIWRAGLTAPGKWRVPPPWP